MYVKNHDTIKQMLMTRSMCVDEFLLDFIYGKELINSTRSVYILLEGYKLNSVSKVIASNNGGCH